MHPIGTVVLIKATITEHDITDEDGLCYGSQFPGTGEQWFGEADIFAVVSEPVCAEQAPEPKLAPKFKVGDWVIVQLPVGDPRQNKPGQITYIDKDANPDWSIGVKWEDGSHNWTGPKWLTLVQHEAKASDFKLAVGDQVTSGQFPGMIGQVVNRVHEIHELVYLIQYGNGTVWISENNLHKVTID
jgi:hypothetical protein